MTYLNLVSLIGLFVLPVIAWACSTNRRVVNWRVTIWGLGLQLAFAAFIFALPAGRKVFLIVNDLVVKVVEVAGEGGKFVFGPLANPPGTPGSLGFILATQALPTIIFFAALLGLLYHFRILPRLIEFFARVFGKWMRLSGAESLCVASNLFVGALFRANDPLRIMHHTDQYDGQHRLFGDGGVCADFNCQLSAYSRTFGFCHYSLRAGGIGDGETNLARNGKSRDLGGSG